MTIDMSRINDARTALIQRQADLTNQIKTRSPQYSDANVAQDPSWEGKWLGADRERSKQLDWLQQSLSSTDPTTSLTAASEAEAATREKSDTLQAETLHRRIGGSAAANAARSGQSGSSFDAQQQGQMAAALAGAKAKAKSQADELRAAGIAGANAMEEQLVSQIMAESSTAQAAYQAALSGQQVEFQGAQQQASLDSQYRDILAKSLGTAMGTAGTTVAAGFQNADRQNQLSENAWDKWRTSGGASPPPTVENKTWWGF